MNFFILNKLIAPRVYKPIYKSEIKESLGGSFNWNFISILTSEMANEDLEREIRIDFFKSAKTGTHENLGFISFNLAQLKDGVLEYDL